MNVYASLVLAPTGNCFSYFLEFQNIKTAPRGCKHQRVSTPLCLFHRAFSLIPLQSLDSPVLIPGSLDSPMLEPPGSHDTPVLVSPGKSALYDYKSVKVCRNMKSTKGICNRTRRSRLIGNNESEKSRDTIPLSHPHSLVVLILIHTVHFH